MEQVGARIASPMFAHQPLVYEGHAIPKRKHNLLFEPPNYQLQQGESGFQIPAGDWNSKNWIWDSVRFIAKPLESDVFPLGANANSVQSEQQQISDREDGGVPSLSKKSGLDDEDETLRLNLGGGGLSSLEERMSKPNKRVRSGSPAGRTYPMCQVDDCQENLANAKDYHRRHKVCETHSKSSKALVAKQMQRFCQQCSRFHLLSEFDEGKRSCRRRLAGHNRRRRKTQTEGVSSQILPSVDHNKTGNADLDIVNLLKVLAHAQENKEVKSTNWSSLPSKDQIIQILSKISSLRLPLDLEAKLAALGNISRSIPEQASSDNHSRLNGNMSFPPTKDLLAVMSTTLPASPPDPPAVLSEGNNQDVDTDKFKLACRDQALNIHTRKEVAPEFPSAGGESSSSTYQSPVEDSVYQVQHSGANLPLQLFGSSPEDNHPTKLGRSRKYFSSDSSNPIEETSHSSSPTVVQQLFPMQTTREVDAERISTGGEVSGNIEGSNTNRCFASLELFGRPNKGASNVSFKGLPYQAGSMSSSGSDHSPSSFNADVQDRTGRIIFKLFGKDPSQLPGTLRTQVYNWLSYSPSEMESYIKPGCVVLSIYMLMSSSAWEQLEANLLQHVNSLVYNSDTDFWRNGRFFVHAGRQLVSHKDGDIRICKSWRAWHSPELTLVSPLAVVGGEETSLSLRGRNLNIPGTKIHITHMGGYLSGVPEPANDETSFNEIKSVSFKIHGLPPGVLGRCFIEVENGLTGTSFPVIIANANICDELRLLEREFDEGAEMHGTISEDHVPDYGQSQSKREVLHFLNELGWLFQRKRDCLQSEVPDYALARFKFLFVFSVERDCCALARTLLNILLEGGEPSRESLEMLSDIHLLTRAVKRRCRNMVDLLIRYSVLSGNGTSKYIFPPNFVGPGGVTPLHLAACTSSSDDIVDALTSDPQEIGLHCWNSLLDANGRSPHAYALMRNHHSYNRLVARKLADRRNGQLSVSMGVEIEQQGLSQFKRGQISCSTCAAVASRYNRRVPGLQGFLQQPYMHSILAIAAVCVCVCLFLRGQPDIGRVAPFKWENLGYGSS
ncbi:squamosa promoter-binding-like protein 14 [Diospyros lotus]|uniref:squamosa promoter-binding-like protein 14 n=1 Tax=Diospyros lotus TaxID=55363 RepID=UPI00225B529B|nr:squamosa promoter-binding-like protein 14 [Diospyros lotus]XP_052201899.1 squamosa promoter-binding-like protein 14 [Diospyros lotus]